MGCPFLSTVLPGLGHISLLKRFVTIKTFYCFLETSRSLNPTVSTFQELSSFQSFLCYSRWNMVSFFLSQSGAVVGLLSMRWQFCCWDLGSGVFAWGQLCSKWHRASRRWWVLPDRYRTKHGRKELLYSPSRTNYHDGPGINFIITSFSGAHSVYNMIIVYMVWPCERMKKHWWIQGWTRIGLGPGLNRVCYVVLTWEWEPEWMSHSAADISLGMSCM